MRAFKKKTNSQAGFTLVELIVVIVVLGILAAMAVPRLSNISDRARRSEARNILGTIKSGMEMYYTEHTDYPSSGDLEDSDNLGQYIDSFGTDSGGWHIDTYNDSPSGSGEDYKVTLKWGGDGNPGDVTLTKFDDGETEISP
ncbi:MAG: type II secretion system protein [Bacillota bacterium]